MVRGVVRGIILNLEAEHRDLEQPAGHLSVHSPTHTISRSKKYKRTVLTTNDHSFH
jgi:hypothetical protein